MLETENNLYKIVIDDYSRLKLLLGYDSVICQIKYQ